MKRFSFDRFGLYTDFYELTMAQGYFYHGLLDKEAVFDYFFRRMPCDSGYVIFAGLADLLEAVENFGYGDEELAFLAEQGFRPEFLDYLRDFRFHGRITAPREGEVVFNNEPIVSVKGSIVEVQVIETVLLNFLNFQSLIAMRASRIESVLLPGKTFADFGLRRAQGLAGLFASRAAVIGGASGTSNTMAARIYGLKPIGTMAHSWVQTFDDELEAFRKYVEIYPDNAVLLIDTYDTLRSGLPHAITVAKELEARGHRLKGVRIDSGDMAYLSREVRRKLDAAGLDYVKIIASNSLDEYIIRSLNLQNAQIDSYGVGTKLVTSYQCPALDGVYKLAVFDGKPRLKISEDIAKISLPGEKELWRIYDQNGYFYRDAVILADEDIDRIDRIYHPDYEFKYTDIRGLRKEKIRYPVMEGGRSLPVEKDPYAISEFRRERLAKLPPETKRFENPHVYKVGVSKKLFDLRKELIRQHLNP
ncbi:MAG: nicotinate phosphoribosyltransferase [Chlorobi bacterium]|nr:nicotinate phosphoribosyltransferase [Chlorobiota bacterium]